MDTNEEKLDGRIKLQHGSNQDKIRENTQKEIGEHTQKKNGESIVKEKGETTT